MATFCQMAGYYRLQNGRMTKISHLLHIENSMKVAQYDLLLEISKDLNKNLLLPKIIHANEYLLIYFMPLYLIQP